MNYFYNNKLWTIDQVQLAVELNKINTLVILLFDS
ncbi:XkdX family protein [Clostridioides mangenotii]|nr:XkdX family protein [Clostridioides mangenotii]